MNKIPTVTPLSSAMSSGMAQGNAAVQKVKNLSEQDLKSKKEVDKAAGGFEALLLQEMMQSMWSTVEFSGMFNEKSNEASIYRDMFSQAIADNTSAGRGIGVKEFIGKELLRKGRAS